MLAGKAVECRPNQRGISMTPGRRALRYVNLDEIMPDVDRLLGRYTTLGAWSLAQICHHLATVMRRTVDLPKSTPYDATHWVTVRR
jgi:hypothetical protein